MAKKEKTYVVKVPVYTTEMIEGSDRMFGGISYNDMTKYLVSKIKVFQDSNIPIDFENRNKTRQTVIDKVTCITDEINMNSGILLKISAYSTNLYDGYLQAERKISFKKNYKVGSETNFVLIQPMIKGLDSSKYLRYFIILIYEDPTKNNEEIVKITKMVLNKILNIPIANIKLPTLLNELKEIGNIPELQMKYSALHHEENDVDVSFRQYLVSGELRKQRKDNFRNMPVDKIEQLWNKPVEDNTNYEIKSRIFSNELR